MSDEVIITADDLIRNQTFAEIEAARLSTRYCTYSRASINFEKYGVKGLTQSIFACRTCSLGTSFVGVCEPCMLTCHADHDVFELGLRRDFRCDCATQKRDGMLCQVQPEGMPKMGLPINLNQYLPLKNWSQNKFCTCARHYDESRDKMIQCAACDDWFHDTCVSGYFDIQSEDAAFICSTCTKKFPYLSQWSTSHVGTTRICSAVGKKSTLQTIDDKVPSIQISTIPSSPSLDQSILSSEHFFQPWVCCLTCTEGADDGRGVCMACADTCHIGHVLTQPRITQFACDCQELCSKKTLSVSTELNTAISACKIFISPRLSGVKRSRSELVEEKETIMNNSLVPLTTWCALSKDVNVLHEEQKIMVNASIFADSIESIVSGLCKCSACFDLYAKDRLSSWFIEDEHDIIAPDCEIWLPRTVSEDGVVATSTSVLSDTISTNSTIGSISTTSLQSSSPSTLLPPPGFSSLHDQGMAALSHMPHVQQQTALLAYTNLTSELMPFLKGFADQGKVVTATDIRKFFEELKVKKRSREEE